MAVTTSNVKPVPVPEPVKTVYTVYTKCDQCYGTGSTHFDNVGTPHQCTNCGGTGELISGRMEQVTS